ncbi:glycosyltransferase family 2 protein [Akkermansiaceae bacterium]|nr:glycosyltransferase family 2 protein [Akkermansiaceae bacterium]
MTVTVYIIGWNGDEWLPACLERLHEASEQRLHLVLIDNHNNPGIHDLPLDRFETRVVKTPRKMGFADAHNFGVIAAPPEDGIAVMLNQDTKSEPGWVDQCVACFEADKKLGALMPGLRKYDDDGWDPNFWVCAQENPDLVAELEAGGESAECFDVPVVTAAAILIRTEVLAGLGLFDPIFESYYEDTDFCRRVREAGWKLGICPAARVRHFVGSATTTPEAEMRRHIWVLRNRAIHGARLAGTKRWQYFLRHFLCDVPRRLFRGILRTPSSQPLSAIFHANWNLLKLIPRLANLNKDTNIWRKDLADMAWPWLNDSHENTPSQ